MPRPSLPRASIVNRNNYYERENPEIVQCRFRFMDKQNQAYTVTNFKSNRTFIGKYSTRLVPGSGDIFR